MKKIVITEEQYKKCILNEYLDKFNMMPLKRYLNMSEEDKILDLLHHYSYMIEDIISKSFNKEVTYKLVNDIQREGEYMFFDNLVRKRLYGADVLKTITNRLTSFAYNDENAPSWFYMEYEGDIYNGWLVHFSNDAYGISSQGFKHGTDDLTNLSYTYRSPNKHNDLVGYNFAYDANDFDRFYQTNVSTFRYGDELVMFRASGVKVWHVGDEEFQVIFYGPSAHDFVYIGKDVDSGDKAYAVYTKNGDIVYRTERSDIQNAVYWVMNNYDQYTSKITNRGPEKLRKKYETNYE